MATLFSSSFPHVTEDTQKWFLLVVAKKPVNHDQLKVDTADSGDSRLSGAIFGFWGSFCGLPATLHSK